MNILGKKTPALIDNSILDELIKRNTVIPDPKPIISTPKITISDDFSKSCISFLYKYGFIILIISIVSYYLWNRYMWYKTIKIEKELEDEEKRLQKKIAKKEKEYVNYEVPILPRPIPAYRENAINDDMRSMYLDKLEPKRVSYIPTQIRTTSRRSEPCNFDNYRLDNIYGQPQYNVENVQPFSGESFYATA